MLMDDYQQGTWFTARYPDDDTWEALSYVTLGLAGEAGEIANKTKKIIRDDRGDLTEERRRELIDELGDVLWYCAALATELDVSLSRVAQNNLDKLASRAERDAIHGRG